MRFCNIDPTEGAESIAHVSILFDKSNSMPFMGQNVHAYESEAIAKGEMELSRSQFMCKSWEQVYLGQWTTFEVAPMSFPKLGEESMAYGLTYQLTNPRQSASLEEIGFNAVAIRIDNVVVVLGQMDSNRAIDTEGLANLARIAEQKLRSVAD